MTNPHTALAAVLPPALPAAANLWVPGKALKLHERFDNTRTPMFAGWEDWLRRTFPHYVTAPFAERHHEFWDWVWALRYQVKPQAFIAIWPRGGGKSASAEMAAVLMGRRRVRRYVLFISETRKQAEQHIQSIMGMLESPLLAKQDPELTDRKVSKFKHVSGWNQQRIMARCGFTVDALALEVGVRGIRDQEARPDLIIFDDVDGRHDTAATIEKKIQQITESILPAGSKDVGVLGVQNLIHQDSIFYRLAYGTAAFLYDRKVSGPYPALRDATYGFDDARKQPIVTGTPTWAGQSVETCNDQIAEWGLTAFRREAQQEVEGAEGAVWEHVEFQHCRPDDIPSFINVAVACDPAVVGSDGNDAAGICVGGRTEDGRTFLLHSREERMSPQRAMLEALRAAIRHRANFFVVETDQGGKTWISVFEEAWRMLVQAGAVPKDYRKPAYIDGRAGSVGSKTERALRCLTDYEKRLVIHVQDDDGTWRILERALKRAFIRKPFDLADCVYWCWDTLRRHAPIDRTRKRETRYVGSFAPARRYERRR